MKEWLQKMLMKWQSWLALTILFLICVQVLFTIPAPCKWLDAVWEAGDFISLVGTLVLGYVAMCQTQRANKMAEDANNVAKDANETSRKLIQLQEEEYLPVVTVSTFAGVMKHELSAGQYSSQPEMNAVEMRDENNEVSVGYSLSILAENTDLSQKTYCRDYEIHFLYSGHFVMSSFKIKAIKFCGNDFEKEYIISNSAEMSLCDKEELILLIFFVSNEDFMKENSSAYNHIKSNKFIIEIEMVSMQGKVYTETITIQKMLIKEPEPTLKQPNIEMMLSAVYQVDDKNNRKQ